MNYRIQLIKSIQELDNIRSEIFTQILNLSMSGEMNEINEVFDSGEVYSFDIKQFEDSKDNNVIELVNTFKNIDNTINALINVNAVSEEELDKETL